MTRFLRLVVRRLRRRRHTQTPARTLALELELGYVENTARNRARLWRLQGKHRLPSYMFEPGAGQRSPRGTERPPPVTVQGQTPPPATYVPEDR